MLTHRFPKSVKMVEMWKKSLCLDQFTIDELQKRYVVCTKHFSPMAYRNETSAFLNSNATPNLGENEDNNRRFEKKKQATMPINDPTPLKKARIVASSSLKEENNFVILNQMPKQIPESRLEIKKIPAKLKNLASDQIEFLLRVEDEDGEYSVHENLPDDEQEELDEKYRTHEHEEVEENQLETLIIEHEQFDGESEEELHGKEEFHEEVEILTSEMATQTEDREDAASNASTEGCPESKDDKLIKILYPEFAGMSKIMMVELVNEKNNRIQNLEDKIAKLELAMRNLL